MERKLILIVSDLLCVSTAGIGVCVELVDGRLAVDSLMALPRGLVNPSPPVGRSQAYKGPVVLSAAYVRTPRTNLTLYLVT